MIMKNHRSENAYKNLKPVNPGNLYSQSASANFSNIPQGQREDFPTIMENHLKEQIPPGQHNCNERDMTKNEKPIKLVPSQTVISSEELWLSVPGQCSHCCSHAESTAPYSLPHRTVLKMSNMILTNSIIHQNSHTNAKC